MSSGGRSREGGSEGSTVRYDQSMAEGTGVGINKGTMGEHSLFPLSSVNSAL